jgi:hypothetical protein
MSACDQQRAAAAVSALNVPIDGFTKVVACVFEQLKQYIAPLTCSNHA